MATRSTGYLSKHFQLHELAANIFAAIHRPGGASISNAGLIYLGRQLLCFDAFLSPLAATDLNLVAESMFDRTIDYLVFSHHHSDHTWGSPSFSPDTEVIASALTRQLLETAGQDEIRFYRENYEQMQALLNAVRDTQNIMPGAQTSTTWQEFLQTTLDTYSRARVRQPTLTFSKQMMLHGSRESVQLILVCGGHTASDTMLYLPKHEILFTGDLVTIRCHPYLPESTPGGFLAALQQILDLSPRVIVPGHGPVGTLADVHLLVDYYEELQRIAARRRASGIDTDPAAPVQIPERFQGWAFDNYFQDNLRWISETLS